MKRPFFLTTFLAGGLLAAAPDALAQDSPDLQRAIDKATREILPSGTRRVEEETDAKVAFEIDSASYGQDAKAWGNLNITVHRIVSALLEIGKDQVGKDALAKMIRKVAIYRTSPDTPEDTAELKDGTLFVRTTGSDQTGTTLQGVVKAALEKALGLPTTPEKTP